MPARRHRRIHDSLPDTVGRVEIANSRLRLSRELQATSSGEVLPKRACSVCARRRRRYYRPMPLSLRDVYAARRIVYRTLRPTPLLQHPLLNQETGLDVYVKHENHNPTSAFKV